MPMYDCPPTATRRLSVVGKRTFGNAAYRHIGDAITQVIPARYVAPAGANIAGSRTGPTCPNANILSYAAPADS